MMNMAKQLKRQLNAEKVAIGFVDNGMVHGAFAHSLALHVGDMSYFDCFGGVIRASSSRLNVARNSVVRNFLEDSDHKWLLMWDTDMVYEEAVPMKLWLTAQEYNAKMVSGVYFSLKDTHRPTPQVLMLNDEGKSVMPVTVPLDYPFEALAAGLGCALIHREVFEAMEPARSPELRWFDDLLLPFGPEVAGEDVSFFVRARELGYRLIVDPSIRADHYKMYPINEDAHKVFLAHAGDRVEGISIPPAERE